MDALVMCGGRGTRLDADREKPLVRVGSRPMVDRVCDALGDSRVETTYAVVSPHAPATRDHVTVVSRVPTVETPGEGYVADLGAALGDDRIDPPVLTVAADLALLDGAVVDRVLAAHDVGSLTVAVPAERKRTLGVSVDTTFERDGRELAPSGVNVVGADTGEADGRGGDGGADEGGSDGSDDGDETLVLDDERLAVNVNRPGDRTVAEALLGT